jgi:TatD DNase family protein
MVNFHTHTSQSNAICNIDSSKVELNSNFYYSIGNHPWTNLFAIKEMEIVLLNNKNIIAIGECGIDKLRSNVSIDEQITLFKQQVELSEKYELPMILHVVKGFDEIINLKKVLKPKQSWVIHGFNKYNLTAQLISHGFYLSLGEGLLKNDKLQQAFSEVPMDKIFFETDDTDIKIEKIYTFAADLLNIELSGLKKNINKNLNTITHGRLA